MHHHALSLSLSLSSPRSPAEQRKRGRDIKRFLAGNSRFRDEWNSIGLINVPALVCKSNNGSTSVAHRARNYIAQQDHLQVDALVSSRPVHSTETRVPLRYIRLSTIARLASFRAIFLTDGYYYSPSSSLLLFISRLLHFILHSSP